MTKTTNVQKTVNAIHDLEERLTVTSSPFERNGIKDQLRDLYKLRKKQKNYTPPPPKRKNLMKGF